MNRPTEFILLLCLILGFACRQEKGRSESESTVSDSLAMTQTVQTDEGEISKLILTYRQQKGKRLYDHYCAVCHGTEGAGDGFNAYNLNPRPHDMTKEDYLEGVTDDYLVEAINQGGRGVMRSVLMPSYERTLSRAQIVAIVAYLRRFGDEK